MSVYCSRDKDKLVLKNTKGVDIFKYAELYNLHIVYKGLLVKCTGGIR